MGSEILVRQVKHYRDSEWSYVMEFDRVNSPSLIYGEVVELPSEKEVLSRGELAGLAG